MSDADALLVRWALVVPRQRIRPSAAKTNVSNNQLAPGKTLAKTNQSGCASTLAAS